MPLDREVQPSTHVLIKDLTISNNTLEILIKCSKTDQAGNGAKVIIGPSHHKLCPVKLLQKYLHYHERAARIRCSLPFSNSPKATSNVMEDTSVPGSTSPQIWHT